MKPKLKPCDTVRVVGSRGTAKIRAILTSMHGALLEKHIDGFRRWNLDELRLVKRAEAKGNDFPLFGEHQPIGCGFSLRRASTETGRRA